MYVQNQRSIRYRRRFRALPLHVQDARRARARGRWRMLRQSVRRRQGPFNATREAIYNRWRLYMQKRRRYMMLLRRRGVPMPIAHRIVQSAYPYRPAPRFRRFMFR